MRAREGCSHGPVGKPTDKSTSLGVLNRTPIGCGDVPMPGGAAWRLDDVALAYNRRTDFCGQRRAAGVGKNVRLAGRVNQPPGPVLALRRVEVIQYGA